MGSPAKKELLKDRVFSRLLANLHAKAFMKGIYAARVRTPEEIETMDFCKRVG